MLKVYNLIGQEIITLVNKEQYAGNYSIIWNGKISIINKYHLVHIFMF